MESTDWSPERKVVGGAIAGIVAALAQAIFDFDLPPGTEAGVAIVVAYLLPNRKS